MVYGSLDQDKGINRFKLQMLDERGCEPTGHQKAQQIFVNPVIERVSEE